MGVESADLETPAMDKILPLLGDVNGSKCGTCLRGRVLGRMMSSSGLGAVSDALLIDLLTAVLAGATGELEALPVLRRLFVNRLIEVLDRAPVSPKPSINSDFRVWAVKPELLLDLSLSSSATRP